MRRMFSVFSVVLTLVFLAPSLQAQVDLKKGDRIVFIGSNTAERFQYFGYWEALLQSQFKDLNLSVRNQGFNGDEVRFRPRSLDFGTPDDHLNRAKADVIFAFFGFSESFRGESGLETFTKELDQFLKHTLAQN